MAILNPNFKVLKIEKNIGGKYKMIKFKVGYKRKFTGILNYKLRVEFFLSSEELNNFLSFYNNEINCINGFNASFEILRQNENQSYFFYKFLEEPKISQTQGDCFILTADLIRIVEGCPANYLLILSALNNMKANNQGENRSNSLYVSCPIAFNRIGVILTNMYNTLKEVPNDYSLSYTFT